MSAILELIDLTLCAGERTLMRAVNARIRAGEMWCLLGPNGAGKTTLLHTIVGLREPDGGSVRLAGRQVDDWSAHEAARLRGFLPQTLHDAFSTRVLDSVMLGRYPYLRRWQWEDEDDRDIARAALDVLDLAGFEERDVLTLSGGERQRVALAALLAQDAPLLLLDEPVSHLDLHHQIQVLHHLAQLARDRDRAILFTVHDLNLAARYATHVLLIEPQTTVHGDIAEVMNETHLARAFRHRVARIQAEGHTVFIPE